MWEKFKFIYSSWKKKIYFFCSLKWQSFFFLMFLNLEILGHLQVVPFTKIYFHCNGNPLQCSCLENPRDGGAWWAAVYGVTESRTWLKWLGGSSSREFILIANISILCYFIFFIHLSSKYLQSTLTSRHCPENWVQTFIIPRTYFEYKCFINIKNVRIY